MTCSILQGLVLDRVSSVVKADSRSPGWYLEMLGQCIGVSGHCRGRTGGLGDWTSGSEIVLNCIKWKVRVLGRDTRKFTVIECLSFGNG